MRGEYWHVHGDVNGCFPDSEPAAGGECELGDDLCGRFSDADGDDRREQSELPVESGRSYYGLDRGIAGLDDDLHSDGDGRHDRLREQRFGHGDGQSAAGGECELGDDLRWRFSDADGDDRREQSELSVESGRSYYGFDYGFTGLDDDLHSDGDGRHDRLRQQRFGHGDGEPVADGECELGGNLCGRFGDADRDDEREQPELLVESGRCDDGLDYGLTVLDGELHGDGDRRCDGLREQRFGHGDGQSAADGECELDDNLRGRFGDADGDDEREQSELSVESGWSDNGFDHGLAVLDHDLHGDGDRRCDRLRQQRFGHGDGESGADDYDRYEQSGCVRRH